MDSKSLLEQNPILLFFLALSFVYAVDRWVKRRPTLPLPPGPKGLPIVGNLFDAPVADPEIHKTFRQWSEKYGSDIVFFALPSQPTLIINKAKIAFDLLEKRSHIYSDRPTSMMTELTGLDFNFALMSYSPRWRLHRRIFHQYFNANMISRYDSEQINSVRAFIRRTLNAKPSDDLMSSVSLAFGASILKVVYGVDIDDTHHEYITLAHDHGQIASEVHELGRFWIDYFPFFKNVPAWIPGVQFKRYAQEKRPIMEVSIRKPYDDMKNAAASGKAEPSVAHSLLVKLQALHDEVPLDEYLKHEEATINTTGVAYAGGTDTSSSSALSFLIAMAKYPHIQKKAQAELDDLLGVSRLPDFSDYDSLPYICAVAMEIMRFKPVTPLGVPHKLMEDDEYNGYFIPKGTIIIPNFWATLHDPEDYPDPEAFKPERFLKDGQLDPTVRDPMTLAFGYGRRICPGRFFSNKAMFLFIASTLQVFNIEPAKDANGNPVDLDSVKYNAGLIATPESLPCILTPRSEGARCLVLQSA
ncbi:cytochrome P450 family protein [Abortiporus biennis]